MNTGMSCNAVFFFFFEFRKKKILIHDARMQARKYVLQKNNFESALSVGMKRLLGAPERIARGWQ